MILAGSYSLVNFVCLCFRYYFKNCLALRLNYLRELSMFLAVVSKPNIIMIIMLLSIA